MTNAVLAVNLVNYEATSHDEYQVGTNLKFYTYFEIALSVALSYFMCI